MSNLIADRVQETTATTGTGTLTLAGASTAFRTFSSALSNSDTCDYCLLGGNGTDWETGNGTYSSGTLTRDTVYASSNSGSKISLIGTSTVFVTVSASKITSLDTSSALKATFDGSTSSVGGVTAFAGAAALVSSITDGDSYSFRAVMKKDTSVNNRVIFTKTKNAAAAILFDVQTDGNMFVEDGSVVLGGSSGGSGIANNAAWMLIEGRIVFSTSYTFVQMIAPFAGKGAFTSAITFPGSNLWCAVAAHASGEIGRVELFKISP